MTGIAVEVDTDHDWPTYEVLSAMQMAGWNAASPSIGRTYRPD